MKRKYCNPESALYELNGEIYSMDDLADLAERYQLMNKIKHTVCSGLSFVHAVGFVGAMMLAGDADNPIPYFLAMIYCFAGATVFGLIASAGGGDNDGSDNR